MGEKIKKVQHKPSNMSTILSIFRIAACLDEIKALHTAVVISLFKIVACVLEIKAPSYLQQKASLP